MALNNQQQLVFLFYAESIIFGSFNAELNHFDRLQTIQFRIILCLHTVKCQNCSISNNLVQHKYTVSMSNTAQFQTIQFNIRGCPRGVMVKAMDCEIVVSEFELQSRYYVHFRANTLGKGKISLILPAMG